MFLKRKPSEDPLVSTSPSSLGLCAAFAATCSPSSGLNEFTLARHALPLGSSVACKLIMRVCLAGFGELPKQCSPFAFPLKVKATQHGSNRRHHPHVSDLSRTRPRNCQSCLQEACHGDFFHISNKAARRYHARVPTIYHLLKGMFVICRCSF